MRHQYQPVKHTTVVYTVALKASNETPPITNAESNGSGNRGHHGQHHEGLVGQCDRRNVRFRL